MRLLAATLALVVADSNEAAAMDQAKGIGKRKK